MNIQNYRRFSSGCALLLVLMIVGVLLVGCESISNRQARIGEAVENVAGTASGVVTTATQQVKDAVELGKSMVGTVQEGIESIKSHADAVQEGLEKLNEGRKLIEEGFGGDEEN